MEQASFGLSNYKFSKVELDTSFIKNRDINVSFDVAGKFYIEKENSHFELKFEVTAKSGNEESKFITVICEADFEFQHVRSLEEIPDFFYQNCIAILFPYVRAYISIITSQANVDSVILPTLNLSQLSIPLKENTATINN